MELEGRVAVVTGAASGIGLAFSEACLREGMRVVMADIEEPVLAREVDRITSQGGSVMGLVTDVAALNEVQGLAEETERAFGPVDVLANVAGVGTVGPPVWKLTNADWRWVLDVNLFGVIHGLEVFLPGMVQRGEGHIINISSAAGLLSPPGMAPYAASKHAVVAISEVLHHELTSAGSGVAVTLVCPGLVATNMADNERNRQAAYRLSDAAASARLSEFGAAVSEMRTATAGGSDPEEFAAEVMKAVKERRFYVVPERWILESVRVRATDILEQRNPTDPS